jgi:hypothetical protein
VVVVVAEDAVMVKEGDMKGVNNGKETKFCGLQILYQGGD